MKNENTNTKNNLKTDIMDKIESGRVKIKSKVQARGEEIGFVLALIISILGSAFTFNMLIFWARGSGHLHYLGLGGFGILAFMRSFPHLWFWVSRAIGAYRLGECGIVADITSAGICKHVPRAHELLSGLRIIAPVCFHRPKEAIA